MDRVQTGEEHRAWESYMDSWQSNGSGSTGRVLE